MVVGRLVAVLVFCLLLPFTAAVEEVRSLKKSPVELPTEVRYVSTGPRSSVTRALRITLLVYEVYFSIGIDEIEFGAEESEPNRISASHFLSGAEAAPSIGLKRFTSLQFVRWVSPSEFELREGETLFRVRYKGDGVFELDRASD